MDSMDHFRERVGALEQQMNVMGAHTCLVERRLHRWRERFLVVPPLAAVIFALALTIPALAAVENVTFSFTTDLYNPCNGERVSVSGDIHSTFITTSDGHGGFHLTLRANYENVVGVGDQGNTYHVPSSSVFSIHAPIGQEQTITLFINCISLGSAPNFIFRSDFHYTLNPDGTLTAYHSISQTECRGR